MKRITSLFLSFLIVFSLSVQSQTYRNKKYDFATAGSGIALNIASDVQIVFASGTKTLSAPYSVTVTGTPVDGKTILMFWDGTSLTTSSNVVTLFGVALTDKQAVSKLVALTIYKTNGWETRIFNDAKTIGWIGKTDLSTTLFADNSTIEVDSVNGVQLKDDGITNAKIKTNAAIGVSKLALTHAIDSGMISLSAKIPHWKMLALTANRVPVIDANGFVSASATTSTELGYVAGVTSALQTQINSKTTSGAIVNADINASAAIGYSKLSLTGLLVNADLSTSAALAWSKMAALTANKIPYINASGVIAATSVTDTELGYLSGVTSNVQTQLSAARSSRTYTETSSTPLVLNSSATDSYLIKVTSTPIVVTLPAASDFAKYRTIEFTRLGSVADSSISIIAAGSDAIEGAGGSEVSNYRLEKAQAGGAGVSLTSNGVDKWIYTKRW
jgi:hypothetical protein